jgi:hypothetical protein
MTSKHPLGQHIGGYPTTGQITGDAIGTAWERAHKATIWQDDVAHTFTAVRHHSEEPELKLHADTVAKSPIPLDPAGWQCLVSMGAGDVDLDTRTRPVEAKTRERTVDSTRTAGRHIILTLR